MPKRVGHLYEKLSDRAFVKAVLIEACKHRHGRKDVARVQNNIDAKTEELCRLLEEGRYKPRKPNVSYKYDPSSQKTRVIRVVPFFPDCCVQWLIVELLRGPVFMRGMDPNSCASIPGRGGIRIYKKLSRHIARKRKQSKYALQCDVHHYYDNIPIPALMDKLRRRCKDEELLALIENILVVTAPEPGKGLCIGFYMNQWLANFFLESTDRAVRESRVAKCYTRYMDNMTAIGGNKRKLHRLRVIISEALSRIGLELKGDWQVFPIRSRPVQAVGYRYTSDGHIMLRNRTWKLARRQFIRVMRGQENCAYIPPKMARGFMSRTGNLKHLKSQRTIYRRYICKVDFFDIKRRAA